MFDFFNQLLASPLFVLFPLAIIGVLATYAREKRRTGKWGEMLFGCHVASATIAVGLLFGWRWPVAIGFVFELGVGLPAWAIHVAANRTTTLLETVAHLLPTAAAIPFVFTAGVPRAAGLMAWVFFLGLQLLSARLTDPALNVNLAHRPSPELARVVSQPRAAKLVVAATSLLTLTMAEFLVGRLIEGAHGS